MPMRLKDLELVHSAAEEFRRAEKRAMREMLSPSVQDLIKEAMPTATKLARQFEQAQRDDLVHLALDSGALGGAAREAQRQFAEHLDLTSSFRSTMQEVEQTIREQFEPLLRPAEEAFRQLHQQHAALFEGLPEMALLKSGLAQVAESISGFGRGWLEPIEAPMRQIQSSMRELLDQSEFRNASSAMERLAAQVRDLDYSAISDARSLQDQMRTISWRDVVEAAVELHTQKTDEVPRSELVTPATRRMPSMGDIFQVLSFIVAMIVLLRGDNLLGRDSGNSDTPDSEPTREIQQEVQVAVATPLFVEPSAGSHVIDTLQPGTWIRLVEKKKAWLLVEVDLGESSSVRGWISQRATQPLIEPIFEAALQQLHASIADQLPAIIETRSMSMSVPALIADAGDMASKRYIEFFTASIRNRNTRSAYWHACSRFLTFCGDRGLTLSAVEPFHVAAYIEELTRIHAAPTIKQHLAAVRRMFDFLVIGQIIPASPAASVRGPKHVVTEGKTPILDAGETRHMFAQFEVALLADLRDRAILGTMVFSFARVGALVKLRVRDYYRQGAKAWFVLDEKGGKQNRVPVHHLAAEYVEAYIDKANIGLQRDTPLFRSFGRGKGREQVADRGLARSEIFAIVRRRAAAVGLPQEIGCHSFRGTGITNYLSNGGTIETAAKLAGHSSTRTTQLYDRRHAEVALSEIERIRF